METVLVLASRGRPHNLRRFAEAYDRTEAVSKVVVGLDYGDPKTQEYRDLNLHQSFTFLTVGNPNPGACFVQNKIFEAYPNADVYGIVADDVIPTTKHWDVKLAKAAVGGVSFCADGMHDGRFATHPFIDGDLVRKYGFIAPPGLKHLYVDNFWNDVGAETHLKYLDTVRLEHHHWSNDKAPKDETYNHQYAQGDEAVYRGLNHG